MASLLRAVSSAATDSCRLGLDCHSASADCRIDRRNDGDRARSNSTGIGILLPRQELALGRWAWLVNTVGWALFHVPFGVPTVAVIWPLLLILPYIVWRQRNTWIGIIVHAALNGPGFVAVAFGLV